MLIIKTKDQHWCASVLLVSAIAALAGLLFGFDTGIISGALLFIQKTFTITTGMKEFIVSSVLLGAMFGALLCGRLTDLYGRRRVLLVVALMFIVGTLVAASAGSPRMIIVGRIILGLAIGIGSYTAPLYIAEAVPSEIRGALVSLNQLAITIGIMCSYFINYAFTGTHGSWRWMFLIGIIPATLLGLGMILLPESPRWLVMHGQIEKARDILRRLRVNKNIDKEVKDIEKSLTIKKAKFREVFSSRIRPVLIFGITIAFLQQVVGINTIIYYAPTIFQLAGFHSDQSSILATVGIGIVNVLATVMAIYLIDRIGRRPLLLWGIAGMALSLMSLSFIFFINADLQILRWLAFTATFVYIISFAVSLGAIMWLMLSEIFPLEVRGTAMGIAVFGNWFWNFIISGTFLTLLDAIGPANTFLLYAIMAVVAFLICFYVAPETKGISLEQIQENIHQGLSVRCIGRPKRPY